MHSHSDLPVVVVGAGPVGLAAAAHLVTRGLRPLVVEAGNDVGANLLSWGHVRLFSPWRYSVDRAAAALLESQGWQAPAPEQLPTGRDLVERYLRPLSRHPKLADAIRLQTRVVAITRLDMDKVKTKGREKTPFVVRVQEGDGSFGEIQARAVIDASGTWASPNPLGASGLAAIGEAAARERIEYGIPDILGASRARYLRRTTLVVGAGHSAANSILALVELVSEEPRTSIIWATRGDDLTRVFGGGESDQLPARGKIGSDPRRLVENGSLRLVTGFRINEVRKTVSGLEVIGSRHGAAYRLTSVDEVIAATGQRPDLTLARELRTSIDPWLESVSALGPLIDPNLHSCGSVRPHGALELAQPEPGFYVIGVKSYGRAPTFLLATGHEQARSVVAMLAGDREAAMRVELELPETGVCSSSPTDEGACCGPSPEAAQPTPKACCGPSPKAEQPGPCC